MAQGAIQKAGQTNPKTAWEFEELLLSYVDMCYSVALALTHRPEVAEELTRMAMNSVWRLRSDTDAKVDIKTLLLQELRKQFLIKCRPATLALSML